MANLFVSQCLPCFKILFTMQWSRWRKEWLLGGRSDGRTDGEFILLFLDRPLPMPMDGFCSGFGVDCRDGLLMGYFAGLAWPGW